MTLSWVPRDGSELTKGELGSGGREAVQFPGGLQNHETTGGKSRVKLKLHLCFSLYVCFILSLLYFLPCSISVLTLLAL